MNLPRRPLSFALGLWLSMSAVAQNPADLIQTSNIKAEMVFLSSDAMAGRRSGSHEAQIAANYIASEFLRFGLKPMGDGGTYFQNFDMLTAWPDKPNMALVALRNGVKKSYQLDRDFDMSDLLESNNPATVTGPLVFLGYGVNAPEYGYNDFSGFDLHGKIALVLTHEPQESDPNSRFKGTWNTIHAYDVYKYQQIRKAGAAGLLIVKEGGPSHWPPDRPDAPHDWSMPTPLTALTVSTWDLPIFAITEATADELLASSGKTIATLQKAIDQNFKPQSFPVPGVEIRMKKALKDRHVVRGRNVIALLEGSDPKLKDEYVVISGHYDHMGIVQGRIYRGADDNASGTIGVIESARAYTQGKVRPRRSIMFIAFDAEETAIGSEYFIENPVLPLEKGVADLNMDSIGRDEDTRNWKLTPDQTRNSVNLVGTLYNPDLRRTVESNNQSIGLQLDFKTDTNDIEEWFDRSDHTIFATKSIPMVLFTTGEHRDYHTEQDTWDRINYPKLEKIIRLIFLTSLDVANADNRPRFTP